MCSAVYDRNEFLLRLGRLAHIRLGRQRWKGSPFLWDGEIEPADGYSTRS
jgi:hypothetical protein